MKALELDLAIEANSDLLAAVRQANKLLESELGRSSGLVSATWKLLHDDRDQALLRLTISDWSGNARTVFTPDDLKGAWKTQGRGSTGFGAICSRSDPISSWMRCRPHRPTRKNPDLGRRNEHRSDQ